MAGYSCKFCKKSTGEEKTYIFRAHCGENLIVKCWALFQKKRFFEKMCNDGLDSPFCGDKKSLSQVKEFLCLYEFDEDEIQPYTSLEELYELVCPIDTLFDKYNLYNITRELVCPGCDVPEGASVKHTCYISRIPEGEINETNNLWVFQ